MGRCGSKTFFKPRLSGDIMREEFEVIEPEELGTRTVTCASVGGQNARANTLHSMRLNVMTKDDCQSDYGDELIDDLDELPEGHHRDNSSDENRHYQSEVSM